MSQTSSEPSPSASRTVTTARRRGGSASISVCGTARRSSASTNYCGVSEITHGGPFQGPALGVIGAVEAVWAGVGSAIDTSRCSCRRSRMARDDGGVANSAEWYTVAEADIVGTCESPQRVRRVEHRR